MLVETQRNIEFKAKTDNGEEKNWAKNTLLEDKSSLKGLLGTLYPMNKDMATKYIYIYKDTQHF